MFSISFYWEAFNGAHLDTVLNLWTKVGPSRGQVKQLTMRGSSISHCNNILEQFALFFLACPSKWILFALEVECFTLAEF